MARLEKPLFAKAIDKKQIVEGVVTDRGPNICFFHPRLPDGTYQKKPVWKKKDFIYYVRGNGPVEFSPSGN